MQDPGAFPIPELEELPPADAFDPIIELYKRDVDRTLLRENLKLTIAERLLKFNDYMQFIAGVRTAGLQASRARSPPPGR